MSAMMKKRWAAKRKAAAKKAVKTPDSAAATAE